MTIEKFLKRYEKNTPRTREYMKYIFNSLIDKYGFISEDHLISLDMLSYNLDLMFYAMEEMNGKDITDVDKYRGPKKNPAIQTFFNAQTYVHKILGSFGFTPAAKSKIKETHEEQDLKKVLDNIRNTETLSGAEFFEAQE